MKPIAIFRLKLEKDLGLKATTMFKLDLGKNEPLGIDYSPLCEYFLPIQILIYELISFISSS